MNHTEHSTSTDNAKTHFWRSAAIWVCAGIILFFLLTEHQAHFFGALPYLLLVSCPLMHLFMHHDHDGHQSHSHSKGEEK